MSVAVKFLGHSTFLITSPGGSKMLIDPWVGGNPACPDQDKELPKLDSMLITHSHMDHFQDAVEVAKRDEPQIGCIYEIASYLERKGIANLKPMNKGGGQRIGDVYVTMTDARHSSSIIEDSGEIWDGGEPAGFILAFEDGYKIYHAGDTCAFSGMQIIGDLYKPDLCMLPIGDLFTMGPMEAAYACKLLGARHVLPMHYGTFPLLTGTPEEFVRLTEGRNLEITLMKPGEERRFGG